MIPPKQILDRFGNPASAIPRAEQLQPVWRRSTAQQNMAAGEFVRNGLTGKYYRDPTSGKYKRATATDDCPDCCEPVCCVPCDLMGTGTGTGSSSFRRGCCLALTISGSVFTNGQPLSDVPACTVTSGPGGFDGTYYLSYGAYNLATKAIFNIQPFAAICIFGLTTVSPVTMCNFGGGCTISTLMIAAAYFATPFVGLPNPRWMIAISPQCNTALETCFTSCNDGSLGLATIADTGIFCTTDSESSISAQIFPYFPGTVNWGTDPTSTPMAAISWADSVSTGTGSSSPTGCQPSQLGTDTSCNGCTGTGTGTGTNPCACPTMGTCEDSAPVLSVNMDALKTCDPDLLGMIVNVPRIASCPSVEYQADFYFGNRHVDITYSAGCYHLSVTQSFPISRTIFHGYSSTLTGTYTYCDGDCTTSPTVGAESCPSNCSTQCGDCTQLGTTFSFIAPVSGQLRLIYNDQYGSFYNNSGSFSVAFTTGDTGTYTCDGTATNGSPGPAVVSGTTYAGTASGTCFWDVTAPCSSNADGVIQSGSNPGCTTVGGTDCSSLTFGSLVAQICTAADIYCDGICDDSASSVSIDTSAFNDGICTSSNTDSASLSGTCLSGTIVWTGTFGVITYNQSCYTLTLTFLCGTWVGTCCTPTGIYCQISDSTGKNPTNVEVS